MADERVGSGVVQAVLPQGGARFFDERRRDRGQAIRVTRRVRQIDGLTTLDVTTTDRPLADFLGSLDKARLSVQPLDEGDESYSFTWASGYDHGGFIRVHGSLDTTHAPSPRR